MRTQEGLPVTLIDDGLLDSRGVFQPGGAASGTASYGLPEGSVQLFLEVALAGEAGLAKSKISKSLALDLSAHLVPLELQNLVAWERDNRGRLAYLVLTWKGSEAIAAARPVATDKMHLAQVRRNSVNGISTKPAQA